MASPETAEKRARRTTTADRRPPFCDIALAERIEQVEADLVAKASEAARHRRADQRAS
jgi:hypothetical protein